MDIRFVIGGCGVTRENCATLGADVTPRRLDRLARAVEDAAGELRCSRHRAPVSVTCAGDTLDTLTFSVAACCPEFGTELEAHLRRRIRIAKPKVAQATRKLTVRRLHRSFGPIAAGLLIDSVDLVTFGPLKRLVGFPAGALAGFWMASIFRLPMKQRLLCALAAGVYCFIPGLEFIPVATLIGAFVRFRQSDEPDEA